DANVLHPYAQSRWSMPPTQLLQQRLRDALAERRPVLDAKDSASLAREGGRRPDTLRVTLEEFSQYFDAPNQSRGLLRLRATVLERSAAGERLRGQRLFTVEQPAPSADAAGGVRALALAS